MNKQTLFEKVPVEKELPDYDTPTVFMLDDGYAVNDVIYDGSFADLQKSYKPQITHWLRELPDRIVLTDDELKEKMKDAFEAAREMQITGWEEGEDVYKSFEQFWNLYNKEEGK